MTDPTPTQMAPLSRSFRAGDLIFVSGMVPLENGVLQGESVAEQTDYVLRAMASELAKHGATMADVVKTTVLMADADRDWPEMNEAYRPHFPDPKPARSAYGVVLADPRLLVEIEGIAVVSS